jgi:hypothetical protein
MCVSLLEKGLTTLLECTELLVYVCLYIQRDIGSCMCVDVCVCVSIVYVCLYIQRDIGSCMCVDVCVCVSIVYVCLYIQ